MKVRPITNDDISKLVAMDAKGKIKPRWHSEDFIKYHPASNKIYRAYLFEDRGICGYLYAKTEQDGLHINKFVLPHRKHIAIKKALVNYFLQKFDEWMIESKLHITVGGENYELLQILKQLGFTINDMGKTFYCVLKINDKTLSD